MTREDFVARMHKLLDTMEEYDCDLTLGEHLAQLLFPYDTTLKGSKNVTQLLDLSSFSDELREIVEIYTGD